MSGIVGNSQFPSGAPARAAAAAARAANMMASKSANPRREDFFFPLEQTFNRFFDEFFSHDNLDSAKGFGGYPKLNAFVDGSELVMHISVPGVSIEDLKLEVSPQNIIIISGKMASEYRTPNTAKVGWKQELRQSSFERLFKLPHDVEGDPSTRLKDGILTLRWKIKSRDLIKNVREIPIVSIDFHE
jgi:HSP20 family molecular chaperone IbpA